MRENLNVLSAFVHLAADTSRSLTVFITSAYVWTNHGDSVRADAVSSIIVCILIILAAVFLLRETWVRIAAGRNTRGGFEPISQA